MLSAGESAELKRVLLDAAVQCSSRGLYQAARWAAETAAALQTRSVDPTKQCANEEQTRLELEELGHYTLAKSYFDCREFDRCAAVFAAALTQLELTGDARVSQKSLFLALYAKYLAGEKRRNEESEMILGPADTGSAQNREIMALNGMLEGYFQRQPEADGWLEYLYGVVLARSKTEEMAKQYLMQSVRKMPYNWSAWLELKHLLNDAGDLAAMMQDLPQNLMAFFFHVYASQELYQTSDQVYQALAELQGIFPDSQFLQTQKALLFYHAKDFEEAERVFSTVLSKDPHRIDSLDHYSNILYVMSDRPKLAHLAQLATSTDKFRPETCCIVGNYYSLKSEHEKAVMYFRRALTLDRTFLSAWTLMGHEYVEMKNTHAAIESYRRAVDVNRKDYRAWYGLGQTYEILEMHYYALFYFQRAASLRPHDAKMWQAVGQCYDKIDRPQHSIKAYKRALAAEVDGPLEDPLDALLDPEILYQIALLYEKSGTVDEAAGYMELTLAQEEGQEAGEEEGEGAGTGVTTTTSRARMWLARWAAKQGNLQRAMELANELCQDGVEVEEAKALIRDVRARMVLSSAAF